MPNIPLLLPAPRNINYTEGIYALINSTFIHLNAEQPGILLFSASRLQAAIKLYCHLDLDIYAGRPSHLDQVGITLCMNNDPSLQPQGYQLTITPDGIHIEARDAAGIFNGCSSLIQLILYYTFPSVEIKEMPDGSLPCLEINDWPDYPNRGVLLDISRDKVPTMETLFNLIDLLASLKINQLQLYTEHTFAYHQHPEVWAAASPITGEEILILDAFCRERYIELVPNQNSFGHMERWLKLPRYLQLAEAPAGYEAPWGKLEAPSCLCPLDLRSLELLKSLYDELLPHFSSRQFNVGCDETFDLGQGRSQAECERLGTGRVYLDFLLKIYYAVTQHGFHMQFWGDIIMAHPELVEQLPKDLIALEWGYEAGHPFEEHGETFSQAGLQFYVCPGTSSWRSIAGRTDNCLGNLSNAAKNGYKFRACGYLITDWGDDGHWQALPVSYLGFAAGAAYAWCYQSNQDVDIRNGLNRYVFLDPSGSIGDLAYDLGNIYREVGIEPINSSALFEILQYPISELKNFLPDESALKAMHHTLELIDHVTLSKSSSASMRPDKELLGSEFTLIGDLLRHACMRGIWGLGSTEYAKPVLARDLERLTEEYRQIWLLRNRPGGLDDSLSHFKIAKKEYQ